MKSRLSTPTSNKLIRLLLVLFLLLPSLSFAAAAARVGTGVTGTSGGSHVTSLAAAAKSTTAGNALFAWIKWENNVAPCVTSVTNTGGDTFTELADFSHGTGNEPAGSLYYALNIAGNAADVVTANFSCGANLYNRIMVEEFSGIATASATDGSVQTNTGTGTSYSTANISTSQSGLVVMGVSGFTALSSWSGTPGTPDFSVGATESDCGILYLISGSAQTVTPAASATGSDKWVAAAQAFKDTGGGGATTRNMMMMGVGQ